MTAGKHDLHATGTTTRRAALSPSLLRPWTRDLAIDDAILRGDDRWNECRLILACLNRLPELAPPGEQLVRIHVVPTSDD